MTKRGAEQTNLGAEGKNMDALKHVSLGTQAKHSFNEQTFNHGLKH
jgi:hypothetical protein